ncbi:type II methionyl aminopeptidase [Candidatus Woesearchaeota archaeon]|nr:type II methionyl aminopeptidase [Candidatus Woesearchaeota archaeon]
MDEETQKKYLEAGRIAAKTLDYGASLIRSGEVIRVVLDKIEEKIVELGGLPAFPVQISLNKVAAHSCADPEDDKVFVKDDLCKLDVGVHIDGYVADTAKTVYLGEKEELKELVEASRNALSAALKIIKPGVTLGEIGLAIQNEIQKKGFSPIRNLSGHGLARYKIHTAPTIPNVDTGDKTTLKENEVIAVEPFATTGKGVIYETERANLFSVIQEKPIRSPYARELLKIIKEYNGLPFTTRWLTKKIPEIKVNFGIKELLNQKIIRAYPELPEQDGGLVSQAEHTVIVREKPIITTLLEE